MAVQLALQPSSSVALPSSHVSFGSSLPLPHCSQATLGMGQLKPGSSVWQSALQPSSSSWLPSSQASALSLTPLPHSSQLAPATTQLKPSSSVHVSLQPSSGAVLPSSHSSPSSSAAPPQAGMPVPTWCSPPWPSNAPPKESGSSVGPWPPAAAPASLPSTPFGLLCTEGLPPQATKKLQTASTGMALKKAKRDMGKPIKVAPLACGFKSAIQFLARPWARSVLFDVADVAHFKRAHGPRGPPLLVTRYSALGARYV